MAVNLFARTTRALSKNVRFNVPSATMSNENVRALIGKREVVGYGFNGMPVYVDRPDYPLPAIRWKEPTSDLIVSYSVYYFECGISILINENYNF